MKASDTEIADLVRQAKPLMQASPDRAARVKAAVMARVAEAAPAPSPPRWRNPVIAVIAIGLGLSAIVATRSTTRDRAITAASAPAAPVAPPPVDIASAPPGAEGPATIDVSSLANAPPEPSPARANVLPAAPAVRETEPAADPLEGEIRLLRAARQALARGDGEGGLRALDEHASEYPNGVLAEERRAMHVTALCSVGRVSDARREARAFEQSSPSSPHIALVRQSCAHGEEKE